MRSLDLYQARFEPGIHLIEASAGTGKTYSIAQLVARFVVEEGVSVEEMGVVTFTRAATAELRQRIQQRLLEVRNILAGAGSQDCPLAEWAGGLTDRAAARRIGAELLKLDLMPIQTIHGFCQHALRQQALEAGELLGQTMLEEDGPLLQAIVDDFWRCQDLPSWQWQRVLDRTPTPDILAGQLKGWKPPLTFVPGTAEEGELKSGLEPGQWEAFADWMDGLCAQGWFNRKACGWWQDLKDREDLPARLHEVKLHPDLLTFLEQQLNGHRVKPKELDRLPDCRRHRPALEALDALGRRQALFDIAWLQRAWRHLQEEYENRLRQKGWLTHDFVVRRLAGVVEQVPMTTLKQRFRVVFIDEFQDTDHHQWTVFSRLFGDGGHFLFLIGDPKQSIYRFRGADLDTYFDAARAARRRWQLDTNYRSHPDLVAAVNRLFQDPRGRAAQGTVFLHPKLVFIPVRAGCRREGSELLHDGRAVPPLEWRAFEKDGQPYRYRNRGVATEQLARQVAGDVIALLERHTLLEDGVGRSLRPGDVAILVRGNDTAVTVRQILREYRLPAVLIDRRSVYETDTAARLHRLLLSLWEGTDWSRVKRVLADGWFGVDAAQLTQLERTEAAAPYLEAFAGAAERWREDSLLAALEGLFRRFGVWGHIAARADGPRVLADLRHLLEMLQAEAARRQLGPQALLTWYRRRLASPAGEAEQLRLESDDDAVQLVTMHSAKGLEYPVVLCFDLWLPEHVKKTDPVMAGGQVVFQAAGGAYENAFADHILAGRQEAMRITYVALTRARAHCRVYMLEKRQKTPPWSPLRHLLARGGDDDLFLAARHLAESHPGIFGYRCNPWHDPPQDPWCPARRPPRLLEPEPLGRDLRREARVFTSYSGLVRSRLRASASDWVERLLEEGMAGDDARLPRGAAFGSLLHALLEKMRFADLARGQMDARLWEQCRRQAGFGEDLELEKVRGLLRRAVTTPVPEFTLAGLDPGRQLPELEFLLPARSLAAAPLNALLDGQPWFRPLGFAGINGFLRGFIDLVAEHEARFYVIDYKSNELDAYDPATLAVAMREHDYGLQALLYSLALHRHLQARLRGYDYQTHFGGVRYLFLRGMDGRPGRGVYGFRPCWSWIQTLEGMLA